MKTPSRELKRQGGGIGRPLLAVLVVIALVVLWLAMDDDAGEGLKKQAELKTLEVIGDAATKRLDFGDDGEGTRQPKRVERRSQRQRP